MSNIIHVIKKSGLSCALKKIKRRIFINDENITSLIAINGAYDYVQKYKYALDFPLDTISTHFVNPYPNKIWTLWLQGFDNAPEVVQKCIMVLQKQYGDDVIVLTNENITHFLDIPDFIVEKNKEGIITNTHYSDIIRFFLIEKYGGLWLDSTIFLLGNIPDYIRFADIFFHKHIVNKTISSINVMAAEPHHPIIRKTIALLLEYWKNEKRTVSYTITSICLAMAIHSSPKMESLWNSMPHVDCINKNLLEQRLFEKYETKHLEIMKQLSVLQKLSWKFPQEKYKLQGTFYDEVVKKSGVLK
ncbi:MAG: capsular polysaccharide synthesis protein [Lentimicrobiaceae bacterium]|nr:capsular polysaccharide synthesis protein [Lentimicrobiaceae bacterium]